MFCPTIVPNGTYLLEPYDQGMGMFAVNMTQEDFVLMHIVGDCQNQLQPGLECDQLLMEYHATPLRKGEIQIQYSTTNGRVMLATAIYG